MAASQEERELERFALAPQQQRTKVLQELAASGTTPHAAFLQGLHAAHNEDLSALEKACEQLKQMLDGGRWRNSSDVRRYAEQLEALLHLYRWKDPQARTQTLEYLRNLGRLRFDDRPPPAALAASGSSEAAAKQLPTSLQSQECDFKAFLTKAVQETYGIDNIAYQVSPSHYPELVRQLLPSEGQGPAGVQRPGGRDLSREEQASLLLALLNRALPQQLGEGAVATVVKLVKEGQGALLLPQLLVKLSSDQLERLGASLPKEQLLQNATWQAALVSKLYPSAWRGVEPHEWPQGEREALLQAVEALVERLEGQGAAPHSLWWLRMRLTQARMSQEKEARGVCTAPTLAAWHRLFGSLAQHVKAMDKGAGAGAGREERRSELGFAVDDPSLLSRQVPELGQGGLDTGPLLPPVTLYDLQGLVWKAALRETLWADPDAEKLLQQGGPLHGLLEPATEQLLLSEAQLLSGRGSPDQWAGVYTKHGGNLPELQERALLEFTPDNPLYLDLQQPAALKLAVKGLKSITVKVYEMQPWNYYKANSRDIDLDCALDGLGATAETVLELGEPAVRKVLREVPLPQLAPGKRGVWIVEVIGGALQSRAVLRRGNIRFVERVGAAGQALTLVYEDGTPVEAPKAWFNGTEYTAAAAESLPGAPAPKPEVVLPFRSNETTCPLVMGDGVGFAALLPHFRHLAEQYVLDTGFHVEPESAAPRTRVPLLVHARLSLHGWDAPLSLLSDVTLTVSTTDAQSAVATQTVSNFALAPEPGKAAVHMLRVPERCANVHVSLTARVRLVLPGDDGGAQYQDLSAGASFPLSPVMSSKAEIPATSDAYLRLQPDGSYTLEVLGQAGEPLVGVPVRLQLAHRAVTNPSLEKELATDAQGQVHLGRLEGMREVRATLIHPHSSSSDSAVPRTCSAWLLPYNAAPAQTPSTLQVLAGAHVKVCVPLPWRDGSAAGGDQQGVYLVECDRSGCGYRRDLTSSNLRFDAPGYVTVHGLQAGWYHLYGIANATGFLSNDPITLRVLSPAPSSAPASAAAGATEAAREVVAAGGKRFALAPDGVGELSEALPLQITRAEVSAEQGIVVELQGSKRVLAAAAVHVLLTRFLPCSPSEGAPSSVLEHLMYAVLSPGGRQPSWERRPAAPPPAVQQSNRRIGDEVRYVLERRQAVKAGRIRPGVLLERPSLLAQPFKSGDTVTNAPPQQFQGEAYSVLSKKVDPATGEVHITPESLAASGIRLPSAGFFQATVLALSGGGGAASVTVPVTAGGGGSGAPSSSTAMEEAAVGVGAAAPLVTSMLKRPFPGGTPCLEAKSCKRLRPGESFVASDASSAKIKVYGSVSAAWTLLGALLSSATPVHPYGQSSEHLSRFQFLGSWSGLEAGRKVALYADYACRELDFFICLQDKASFSSLVAPSLAAKLPSSRTFLDEWMLTLHQGGDAGVLQALLEKWQAPVRYNTLTLIERLLLAASAAAPGGEAAAAAAAALRRLSQDMRTQLRSKRDRNTREEDARRFELALASGQDDEEDEEEEEEDRAGGRNRSRRQRRASDNDDEGDSSDGSDGDGRGGGDFDLLGGGGGREKERMKKGGGGGRGGGRGGGPPVAMAMLAGAPPAPPPPPGARGPMGMMRMMAKVAPMAAGGAADGAYAAEGMEAEEEGEGGPGGPGGVRDMAMRLAQEAAPAFRTSLATKEWSESGWYKLTAVSHPSNLVPISPFWAEYAEHLAAVVTAEVPPGSSLLAQLAQPSYLPQALHTCAHTFTDAVLCLAVLGLPWSDVPPVPQAGEGGGTALRLTAAEEGPCIVYAKQMQPYSRQQQQAGGGGVGGVEGAASGVGGDVGGSIPGHTSVGLAKGSGSVVLLQRIVDPFDVGHGSSSQRAAVGGVGEGEEDEDDEEEEGEREVNGPLVVRKVYKLQVTITSSSPARQCMDVTLTAPRGSVVLKGRPPLWTSPVDLKPFGTQRLELWFYLPQAGAAFDLFPATAARRGKLVGYASLGSSHSVEVAARQPPAPEALSADLSWRQLCEAPPGAANDAALLRYIAEGKDLAVQNLGLVKWRLKERSFFKATCDALRGRGMFLESIWMYAFMHGEERELRELLPLWQPLTSRLGPCANTPLLAKDPVLSGEFRHREFYPHINPRAHELQGKPSVLNADLKRQWASLVKVLAHKASPDAVDLMQAACLLAEMDRCEDAEELLDRIAALQPPDTQAVSAGYVEYLRIWLLLASPLGLPDEAERLTQAAAVAAVHAAAAVPGSRWKKMWQEMEGCCKEAAAVAADDAAGDMPAAGAGAAAAPAAGGEQQRAAPPSLSLADGPTSGTLLLDTTSLRQVQLSVYRLDLELLFSAQPFATATAATGGGTAASRGAAPASAATSNFSYVRPSHTFTLEVPPPGSPPDALPSGVAVQAPLGGAAAAAAAAGAVRLVVDLGALFADLQDTSCVMVEAASGGLLARRPQYRARLAVRAYEQQGVLNVLQAATGTPVAAAYVKVFSYRKGQGADAAVFHKDGYTDRRGRFDYFGLTMGDGPVKYEKMAVLVSHPDLGSTVLEVSPPPH